MPRTEDQRRVSTLGSVALARTAALAACVIIVAIGPWASAAVNRPASRPSLDPAVEVNNLAYDRARHSLVLDISGPVTISTRSLKAPPRLVVDIPAARLKSHNRELVVHDDMIGRVRVSQWKIYPPTVRVVIETVTPAEPLIAVQQTGSKLYITLAPSRRGNDRPQVFTPPPGTIATPRPLPRQTPGVRRTPLPIDPVLHGPITRTRLMPKQPFRWRPTAKPVTKRTPEPQATPTPVPECSLEPAAPVLEMPATTPLPRMTPLQASEAPDFESLPRIP